MLSTKIIVLKHRSSIALLWDDDGFEGFRYNHPSDYSDRWDPRPMRANHYDRAKMQPHKRRYGNA